MARRIENVTVERLTGMDVGCKRDALAAVLGNLRHVGTGLCRTVYVDARERFVYKMDRDGYEGSNRTEFNAFTCDELRRRGLGQYGSPVALYTVTVGTETYEVLAMPFRPTNGRDVTNAEYERFVARGGIDLPDMHPGNYRVSANGRLKITDLGFGVLGRGWS